ncbi:MAG: DNA translocase FtsK 4TM domain-containing protein [Bacteroidales bacterium]|nr:DNA translocase FtsK 4TM domain-containing protein [Bacteroidales bacterium]
MDRKSILKISGVAVALIAFYALISSLSYLFTWKADQSLLIGEQLAGQGAEAVNAGGRTGAGLGNMLIARWFGLGSFALVAAVFVIAVRMIFGRREFPVLKTVVLAVTASMVLSFLLSFVSRTAGLDTVFGGGLGGDCGALAVNASCRQLGSVPTLLIILFLTALWTFFASRRFSEWFLSLGDGPVMPSWFRRKRGEDKAVADGEKEDTEDEDIVPEPEETAVVPSAQPAISETQAAALPGQPVERPEPDAPVDVQPETLPVSPVAPQQPVLAETVPAAVTGNQPEVNGISDEITVVEGDELSTDVLEELPRIDVRDELKNYRFPPLELLEDYEDRQHTVSQEELKRNNYKIRATLKTYKIDVDNVKAVVGPTVTLYKVYPAPGVKISAIMNLQQDIAMALHVKGARMDTLTDSVGIEVANDQASTVPLKALLNDDAFRESKAELPVAIGYTIQKKVKVFDLADAPHLLVAGATKQGKSVGLNVLISSLLYSKHPSELKFVFIDPKMVEFSAYARLLKHYLAVLPDAVDEADEMNNSICKNAKGAELLLRSLCIEMDARYDLMGKALVNKVTLYNQKYKDRVLLPTEGHHYLPYLVVVVDEYADLTMSVGGGNEAKAQARSITTSIIRLAQKGRAAGIHVVLATQRPSVDVVTGLIKMNFPTRIAFRVFSSTDSKTILDSPGAEKLIGNGDMIYYSGAERERVQCAFISNEEINSITDFIGSQKGYMKSYNTPYYLPAPDPEQGEEGTAMVDMKHLDERFEDAARQVVTSQRGSTSDLQRRLGMGYAKAGRVMDQLEAAGIVGPQEGSKPRQVLVADLNELEGILSAFRNAQS